MSETAPNPTPYDRLILPIEQVVAKHSLGRATEITLTNEEDGSWYWVRRIKGRVHHIVCRRPLDASGDTVLERGASLELGADYQFYVTTNQRRAGTHLEDPDSGFEISTWAAPLDATLASDLAAELRAATLVETDIDEEDLAEGAPGGLSGYLWGRNWEL